MELPWFITGPLSGFVLGGIGGILYTLYVRWKRSREGGDELDEESPFGTLETAYEAPDPIVTRELVRELSAEQATFDDSESRYRSGHSIGYAESGHNYQTAPDGVRVVSGGGGSSVTFRGRNSPNEGTLQRLNDGLPWALFTETNFIEKSMETWQYEKLIELTDAQTAAAAVAGELNEYGGLAGVQYEIARRASEEIQASEKDYDEAYNDVLNGWPRELRGLVAAYEYVNGNYDEDFAEEIVYFGETTGFLGEGNLLSLSDNNEAPTDSPFPDNPYESDDFTEEEAELIIHIRLSGHDEAALDIETIGNLNDFRWWLQETEDMETAVDYHHFGRHVPVGILSNFAPPDEWETMEPTAFNYSMCPRCGEDYVVGEVEPGEVTTINHSGEVGEIHLERGNEWFSIELGERRLCGGCERRLDASESPNLRVRYFDEEGNVVEIHKYGDVLRDMGHVEDDLTPLYESNVTEDWFFDFFHGSGAPRGWYNVRAQPEVEAEELVRWFNDGCEANIDPPVAFDADSVGRVRAWFPASEPETAQAAKNIMENGPEAVSA